MHIDKRQEGRDACLLISGELTIYVALELQQALQECLASSEHIELDLRAVTELDTAGVQQLVLLRREADAAGKSMRIVEHSHATREVLALYRLDSFFDARARSASEAPRTLAHGGQA